MLKQDKINELENKTIHLTENAYNKFGKWIDNQNEFSITWNSGNSITGNWKTMGSLGNVRFIIPSSDITKGVKDLTLVAIGHQNQIDFTLQEVLDILEGNITKKYPGKAYEQANVMPGDRIKIKANRQEFEGIVIHPNDSSDPGNSDNMIHINNHTHQGGFGHPDGSAIILEENIIAIISDKPTEETEVLANDSNYCTCGGPSKLHRFDTFSFLLCCSCKLEKNNN